MSDVDILNQDQQMLVAARARVAERLKECREDLEIARSGDPEGGDTSVAGRLAMIALAKARIAELEPLARMLGIE